MQEKLLSTKELSECLGIAVSIIIEYRMNNKGPIYAKLGHLVRYKKSDIDAWVESRKPKQHKQMGKKEQYITQMATE